LEDLHTPAGLLPLLEGSGLILVTGSTGSGKSTTLAAMVQHLNAHTHSHILTLEDPIEHLHPCLRSLVVQREIGRDSQGFAHALRAALREDPDVLLVGEMRDLDTIRLALTAAETGHLVLASLHSRHAASAIERIIDVFEPAEKAMIRTQLAEALRGVLAQTLCPRADGQGRCALYELLVVTPAVRNLIRENKAPQIASVMQTGAAHGMVTLAQSRQAAEQSGRIAPSDR
jgi:twitching motility protein PilT